MGETKNLGVILTASLAGLLFGFDTVVMSGVTQSLRDVFHLDPGSAWFGFSVASALLGTALGALIAGIPGDRWGSRDALKLVGLLYIVSTIGSAVSWSLPSFFVFRFVGGVAIGASSVLAPVYISEIAPAGRRGALTGLFQFNIVLGILVAFVSNGLLQWAMADASVWRLKLAVAGVPAVIFFALMYTIPQSPRWLAANGRRDEARVSLEKLGVADAAAMLAEFDRAAATARAEASHRLFDGTHGRPIVLAILLAMFNQLSGINAILYYLNDIFSYAGFSHVSQDLQAVAIGAANLLFTLVALRVIDRFGRRKLLLTGAVGTAVALSCVAVIMGRGTGYQYLLPMLIAFIAFFAFSQGAVIWVYLAEIFPTAVRSRGQALGSFTHWIMNALIAFVFPMIAAKSRGLPFAFFAVCMVVQFVVVLTVFPETRGVTLESMSSAIDRRK